MVWALADRAAAVAVTAGVLAVLAGCAVAARPRAVQAVGGAGATLAAAVLVWTLSGSGMAAALAMLGVRAATLVVTRPSRRLAAAVVRARRTGATVALGFLDRLSRLVRPGGRTPAEAAAVAVGLVALAQVPFGPENAAVAGWTGRRRRCCWRSARCWPRPPPGAGPAGPGAPWRRSRRACWPCSRRCR
ncbi:hypothetical protein ACFQ0B_28060 [Nonomuraea thailandensis]